MEKKVLSIWLMAILGTLLISGCLEEVINTDPVIQRAEPYISRIVFDNMDLRSRAAAIVSGCPSGDRECQTNEIYRYIVEDFSYYSDPRKDEFIQSPYDTLEVRGGDCEDLTILLISLLENLGINTYFVLTEDHAYGLACGVDTDNLMQYIKEPILVQISKDLGQNGEMDVVKKGDDIYIVERKQLTFTLDPGYLYYYGGDGSEFDSPIEYMNLEYEIYSSEPLTLYVVPSKRDYELMSEGRKFKHFSSCKNQNVIWISDSCDELTTHGGILLENGNENEAVVELDLTFYFSYSTRELLEDQHISYYEIDNQSCVVLDATAGKYGYPGYDANPLGEKIAIDPLTKDYFYLN